MLRVNFLKISSILGIKEFELQAGQFNEISGTNGSGKTSVLESIKAAFGGGHDATLLRKGEEKGEIVLVLDDGTVVRKRVTDKTSKLDVLRNGKPVPKPKEAIAELIDSLSVNPVEFLTAKAKDRVKILLEAMPIEVDADRLTKISGIRVADETESGLQLIEAVRKQVFDDRTFTNRAVKEKDATINQLRLAMPDAPGGVEGNEDELRAKVASHDEARDAELARISTKLAGIKAANQEKIAEIRAEAQRQIDAILAEEREIEGKAAAQREKTLQAHTAAVTPLKEAIAAIAANRSAAAKREQALETIKKMEDELADLIEDTKRQTKALEEIDQYKRELLESLPIPGIEVIDGEIYRDGVPFDRLNTAQQVQIAVEIAKLRAGELGICLVDNLELLDSDTYEEFKRRITESGLQLFVSRVADNPFQATATD